MTHQEAELLIDMLKAVYPTTQTSDEKVKIYMNKFKTLDPKITHTAIERLMDKEKYFPALCDILDEYKEVGRENRREAEIGNKSKPKETQCWVCMDRGIVSFRQPDGYEKVLYCDACECREHYGMKSVSSHYDRNTIAHQNKQESENWAKYREERPNWKKELVSKWGDL